jgi:hypothetical protein
VSLIYSSGPGHEISVSEEDGRAVLGTSSGVYGFVRVPAADVPVVARRIAEAMHEAAGLPAPLILDWLAGLHDAVTLGGVTLGREGRDILFGMPRGQSTGHLTPAEARDLATVLAVYAAEAEEIPDPADVEALAMVIFAEVPDSSRPPAIYKLRRPCCPAVDEAAGSGPWLSLAPILPAS